VAAVTGKPAAHELLRQLGAARLLTRDELRDPSSRPLLSARYAGGVDTVGGTVLSTLLRSCQRAGCVAACGLVGGAELPITVYPFILRGITLCGIDSAECPREKRLRLWHKLAGEWKPALLDELAQEATLSELPGHVERMLRGEVMGRVVVRLGC
jgi:putative YhdH/YhfP family quinone oxidoreductase